MRITEVKTYQETTCGVGIHRAFRLQSVYAETKPYNIGQSRWSVLKEDSGKAVVLGTQGQPLGQTVSSFSSCLLIPLISTLPRLFGECLKGSGYSLRIMSRLTICSTLSIEAWRGWANLTLSTSPKKPYMFIYFSELLIQYAGLFFSRFRCRVKENMNVFS